MQKQSLSIVSGMESFGDPWVLWNRETKDYFKDSDGNIPTFESKEDARSYINHYKEEV